MLTYWYMYLMPFLAAISPWKLQRKAKLFILGLFGFTVALLIGLRHEVGNDWIHYLQYYNIISKANFYDALFSFEPGYAFLNWVIGRLNFGIYGVNLFCGIIFTYGLIFFCKSQPYPWISIGIAMPIVGIVFAMGATRQVAALGFIYIAVTYLMKGSQFKYLMFICIAITFHKSAILMVPFGIFAERNNKLRYQFIYAVVFLILLFMFWDKYQQYFDYYVFHPMHLFGGSMYAYGGRARVWMNVIPLLLYLLLSKNKSLFKEQGGSFWKYLSIAIFISIPSVELFSAATDRVNVYFSVIQIMVWPRIIYMQHSKYNKALIALGIFAIYFMVLYIWLNFARHRDVYVPYQNILFLGM